VLVAIVLGGGRREELLGPYIVNDTKEKIALIRKRMIMAQSKQKVM
jgi:hypothetical protein